METKVCTKCGIEKPIHLFMTRSDKYLYRNYCKMCGYEINKNWKKSNRDKVNISNKKYRENNKERALFLVNRWDKNNKERRKLIKKKTQAKAYKVLARSIIVKKLLQSGFSKEDITPELIEVKRLLIQTKRLCKTSQN